ncbi:hypothetical protein ACFSKN_04665 [Mariniflexile gromovii]|uniref:Uncharacterized protein n=1 Tax=Mariniflexile gromovii TaxID=362523 RepID=A0ABS4BW96_9FLAO|nr:hypothetical protein [Mariniflexile gromovii]MBP0904860.1 hypothetical protein [Mariniflexile gromovii]
MIFKKIQDVKSVEVICDEVIYNGTDENNNDITIKFDTDTFTYWLDEIKEGIEIEEKFSNDWVFDRDGNIHPKENEHLL